MREIFPYKVRTKYPHMSVADTAIWNRFIAKFPDAYERVQYDYHVGDAPPFNTLTDEDEDQNQDMLYRLRIDAIGHNGNTLDIIEIKPNAGPACIGQVKSYKTLFERDEEYNGSVRPVIITDVLKPNMDFLCEAENVKLIIV